MKADEREELFARLARSGFRSRFHLRQSDREYVRNRGHDAVRAHAVDFITSRIAPATPPNDGRQTPMRNHPVVIAQHATGTCCRKCLEKWHGIPGGIELSSDRIDYIVEVIMTWIDRQMAGHEEETA